MPPVGSYVRAFSVMSDRSTASAYSPSYVHAADHVRHHASVAVIVNHGSVGWGGASWDGNHVRMYGICCPSVIENSDTDVSSSPWTSIRVHRDTESGPAVAVSRWPVPLRVTQGI